MSKSESLVFNIKTRIQATNQGSTENQCLGVHSVSKKRRAKKMKLLWVFICVFLVLMAAQEGKKIYFTIKS